LPILKAIVIDGTNRALVVCDLMGADSSYLDLVQLVPVRARAKINDREVCPDLIEEIFNLDP